MKQGTSLTKDQVEEKAAEAVSYAKEELINHSQELFAYPPEVLIGALHGKAETAFTIAEMKQNIQNFLQRKVQE
ncbi:hypothetical protein A8709_04670 [Paenibacillus pectinilyticus]|uniref:YqzN/YkzM domain-containing protein n=1 Tax=Paenibacillus pectinilyticus TaxID=512399 RepID=A0A1C0ZSD8_9BACL|nr:hypothetical protein [Paenibacillus pectinilyticus]OCT11000.1 hypothetical protein A8709_04670 [Paenibacillus pectinilyticus]